MTEIPRKIILPIWGIALLLSAALGTVGFFKPLEQYLFSARSLIAQRDASGEIVVVAIDDDSLDQYGGWPWKRETLAKILHDIDEQGPRKILFDISFGRKQNLAGPDPLEEAAQHTSAEVYTGLLHQFHEYGNHDLTYDYRQKSLGGTDGKQAYLGANLNVFGAPFELEYGGNGLPKGYVPPKGTHSKVKGTLIPSIAVVAAERTALAKERFAPAADEYKIAYFIDHDTIPMISLGDIRKKADQIRGKIVVVAPTARTLRDIIAMPFANEAPGVIGQILGAETLRAATPVNLGWIPALSLSALILLLQVMGHLRRRNSVISLVMLQLGLTLIAFALERNFLFLEIMPAAFMAVVLHIIIWRTRISLHNREIARRDRQTGLPNMAAHVVRLEGFSDEKLNQQTVVAAFVTNSEDIAILLSDKELTQFYNEIARRVVATGDDINVHRAAVNILSWDIHALIGADPESYARSIRAMMLVPFQIGEHRIRAEISLGFCDGIDIPATRRLSNAMNAAQRAGGRNQLYDKHSERSTAEADWRLAITGDVSALIEKGEMHLAFQAKYDLVQKKITGAEALMRWTHEGVGNVPPSDFIPLAEQGNAIVELTEFALRDSLRALDEFRKFDPDFVVSVNLSPVLLDDYELVDKYRSIIREHGYDPSAILFEITEAARISNAARGIGILENMVENGMRLSIDDYGTGHSTLDYLRIIPAHEVKLDRSFVDNLLISGQDRDLVGSTIELAHKLGLKVVAEGVENRETIDVLGRLGCDVVQGYCIGRPVALEDFKDVLNSGKSPKVA